MELKKRFEALLAPADIVIGGDRPWDVRVHDERLYARILKHGTIGVGEAYMDGWWDCDAIDEMITRVFRAGVNRRIFSPLDLARVARAKLVNLQRGDRAYHVGRRHYDVGNDLYERMLDKRMIYSCGYWRSATNLDDAQEAKLALIRDKLQIESGMRVLDIGCGWGGAARYLAETTGCEVVGVTVSEEQAKLAREACAGLPVEIRLQDYRQLDEPFDRIFSIGMFEHVGTKNHATYMEVVRRCLRDPDSLTVLHTIGGMRSRAKTDPWIERYIFPNSVIPSAAQITAAAEGKLVLEDWQNFGPDYDTTLMQWYANISAAWDELPAYDERFRRMWTFYLLSSAGSFRARFNHLWQIVFSREGLAATYRRVA
jgi:cyclopropane-fatty-acyl-phospholipid synthase